MNISNTKNIKLFNVRASKHQTLARQVSTLALVDEYYESLLAKLGIKNQPQRLTNDAKIKDGEDGRFKAERE